MYLFLISAILIFSLIIPTSFGELPDQLNQKLLNKILKIDQKIEKSYIVIEKLEQKKINFLNQLGLSPDPEFTLIGPDRVLKRTDFEVTCDEKYSNTDFVRFYYSVNKELNDWNKLSFIQHSSYTFSASSHGSGGYIWAKCVYYSHESPYRLGMTEKIIRISYTEDVTQNSNTIPKELANTKQLKKTQKFNLTSITEMESLTPNNLEEMVEDYHFKNPNVKKSTLQTFYDEKTDILYVYCGFNEKDKNIEAFYFNLWWLDDKDGKFYYTELAGGIMDKINDGGIISALDFPNGSKYVLACEFVDSKFDPIQTDMFLIEALMK